MKHLIITTLLSAIFAVANANETNDSIEPAPMKKTYPVLYSLSNDEQTMSAIKQLRFDNAKTNINKLITAAKRKKESTEELEQQLSYCSKGISSLRGTDKVIIVDSVVVDKENFLSCYKLSDDLGTLTSENEGEYVIYQTQLNGMLFKPQIVETEEDTLVQIVKCYKEGDNITDPEVISGLSVDGDVNYPFFMSDGVNFYFAARSEDGLGNYDLYATRYDSDSRRFYKAENMGYPYNSYANDYMLVIDEINNLGWFASDRYQPQGKVCVYTFIPNQSRHPFDFENTEDSIIKNASSLKSIAALMDSYSDEEKAMKAAALKRVKNLSRLSASNTKKDFCFIINDDKTYYSLNDFTSQAAKQQCADWLQKSKNLASLNEQLNSMRDNANASNRNQILNLEKRVEELSAEIHKIEKAIRQNELGE